MIRNYPCEPPPSPAPQMCLSFKYTETKWCSISNDGCVDFKNLWLTIHSDTDKNTRSHFHCQASVSKGFIKIHPSFIQHVKTRHLFFRRTFTKKVAPGNLGMNVAFRQYNHANLSLVPRNPVKAACTPL